MIKPTIPVVAKALHRNLVEFGYDTLTLEAVQQAIDSLLRGEEPKEVIGMFAKNMLVKNGYLV